jgi:hypothetical protein
MNDGKDGNQLNSTQHIFITQSGISTAIGMTHLTLKG